MTGQDAVKAASKAWQRVIAMEGINNFRDYGDLPTSDGGRVRKGRLFRSAHHARASAADMARLAELGIATVTDLRHPSEQAMQPSTWLGKLPIAVIEEPAPDDGEDHEAPHIVAFRESDFSAPAMKAFLGGHYGEMPYDVRLIAMYRRYFSTLAQDDRGMLIHCAAGKDRTGILAWLTHHLLGVHRDDALEDYMLSNDAANIADRLPHLRRRMEETYGRPVTDEAMIGMLTVDADHITRLTSTFAERSGSVDGYIRDVLGVDDAMREAIRTRLIA